MDRKIAIIGYVKEIGANWKTPRVSIISPDGLYLVAMKAAGKNLFNEIGNRVKATGNLSKSREGFRRISVSSCVVFELRKDYGIELGYKPEFNLGNSIENGEYI